MPSKDGSPLVSDQDGTTPSVSELDTMQGWMQSAYAALQPGDQFRRFPGGGIEIG
jgi:hypothetical protein